MSRDAVPAKWDATKIAPQTGKKAIVTGANSGIGFITALELARHGADVVLACRNEQKGRDAVNRIREELKQTCQAGNVEFRKLDVSSLASVKSFVEEFKADHDHVDLLINNAGIMAVPYTLTVDGHESVFATNHLGHFALTAQLLDLLRNSKHARVVNISSDLHKRAKVDLKEIMTPKEKYKELLVYNNSKVYNLLFTRELNRRLRAKGIANVIAVTAHPGVTDTSLVDGLIRNSKWFMRQILKFAKLFPILQTPEMGALPTLYAAIGENIKSNDYIGPGGFGGIKGHPTKQQSENVSKSDEHARVLWEESEKLAKLKFTM